MSGVTVSMKTSPKATGALYMKNLRNEKRIEELEEELNTVRGKLPTHIPCNFIKATGDKDCLNVEASERRYSVLDKCCNQFGERDEIQAIIDKLRVNVMQRDVRIDILARDKDKLINRLIQRDELIKELQWRLDDRA